MAGDAEVWNHTVNESLRFSSDPRVGRLLALTLKNWQLIVLTLDFYWRFAAMATARMRIEAVSAFTADNPDTLISEASSARASAAGDAGADFFGLDIGLWQIGSGNTYFALVGTFRP